MTTARTPTARMRQVKPCMTDIIIHVHMILCAHPDDEDVMARFREDGIVEIPADDEDAMDFMDFSGDDEDGVDFMKGFTAVYGISGATQSVD